MATTEIDKMTRVEFAEYLAKKYDAPEAKAPQVFRLAWEYGHSAGHHEVEYYYVELVELAR